MSVTSPRPETSSIVIRTHCPLIGMNIRIVMSFITQGTDSISLRFCVGA